tara:strand:+ start:549 stop:1217 length:669 start_codon:yes stop_codon:yes gene_type:complete
MKKNSALRKMPEIVKGAGGYTYKYTSPQEAYDLQFPEYKGKAAKPAVYVDDILEVKGPKSKTFTKVGKKTPEYKSIMKEISGKLKTKPKGPKIGNLIPSDPGIPEEFKYTPAIRMKRRSDGSVAKLKNESFMKRMKRLNNASSPVMKKGGKTTFFNPVIDGLVTLNKIKNLIKGNMPEYGGIGRDSDKFKREFRKYVKESNKNPKKYPPISSDEFTAKDFIK